MSHHTLRTHTQYADGFTLLELMISLTIGLLLVLVVFSAYSGATAAGRVAEAQGRMNDDAQAALNVLTQQLRMAGDNPAQSDRTDKSRRNPVFNPYDPTTPFDVMPTTASPSSFSIRGCGKNFSNITDALRSDDLLCPVGGAASTNSISVSYEADAFNSVPTTSGAPTDCVGSSLAQTKVTFPAETPAGPYFYSAAENRFYIDLSSAQVPSLFCRGNGKNSTPQPLVENIEDLQLSYGAVKASTLAADITAASVSGYLRGDEVTTSPTLAALPDDSARWAKVVAVRICILARSEAKVASSLTSARYTKCDGTVENTPPDLRLRRAYTTTVVLRNRRL